MTLLDPVLIQPPKSKVLRTGVYGFALQKGKLLLVKQQKGPHAGKFDLPGGGIEVGETIEEALRREFQEEVAMTFDSMKLIENLTIITDGPLGTFHQVGLIYSVHGLSLLSNLAEMEYSWIPIEDLFNETASPFVLQSLKKTLHDNA